MPAARSASPFCRSPSLSKWTRSSPSGPDPLDPGPAGFAHRGLHGPGIRENSLGAVERALAIGAGIEIDVLLSSDAIPVVLHDWEISRFGTPGFEDPRDIAAMTADDLGRTYLDDGVPIASTVSEVLALVSGRVPVLIEAKADPERLSRPRRLAAAIGALVSDYAGTVGVMSFHPLVPRWFARHAPSIRRGLVIDDRWPASRRQFGLYLAAPDFLAVDRKALGKGWVARARKRMPVYAWTIRTAAERAQAEVQADALIWEGDGRPRN